MHPLVVFALVVGGIKLVGYLFSEGEEDGGMFDMSSELTRFHDQEVRLPQQAQDILREHRNKNRTRLQNGLKVLGYPAPCEPFIPQGSYAVNTINQSPDNDYDIDDGVVFEAKSLYHDDGTEFTCRDAKEMVVEAMEDARYRGEISILKNCVRVEYEEGHHVDIPVYRKVRSILNGNSYELASSEWRESTPTEIANWFKNAVINKSPDTENGRQVRRMVRLLKEWTKSRPSWKTKMPSGFILTLLTVELYEPYEGRDDAALYCLIRNLVKRLNEDLHVKHPITGRIVTEDKKTRMTFLRDNLARSLNRMESLWVEDCEYEDAQDVWNFIFKTDFF